MINSKRKGKTGELELAHKLGEYGFKCRRTQQYAGKVENSADVIGLPFIHCEVKRVEQLNIDKAMEQAVRDSKTGLPAVFHRKNHKDWLVTMRLDDFMKVYGEYYSSMILAGLEDKNENSR